MFDAGVLKLFGMAAAILVGVPTVMYVVAQTPVVTPAIEAAKQEEHATPPPPPPPSGSTATGPTGAQPGGPGHAPGAGEGGPGGFPGGPGGPGGQGGFPGGPGGDHQGPGSTYTGPGPEQTRTQGGAYPGGPGGFGGPGGQMGPGGYPGGQGGPGGMMGPGGPGGMMGGQGGPYPGGQGGPMGPGGQGGPYPGGPSGFPGGQGGPGGMMGPGGPYPGGQGGPMGGQMGPGGPGGFGGPGGQMGPGGPSDEEMEKMQQQQDERMKKEQGRMMKQQIQGMKQGMRGMFQGIKMMKTAYAKLEKQGVAAPAECLDAIAKAEALKTELDAVDLTKIEDPDALMEKMSGMMDIGPTMQECGPQIQELFNVVGMIKDADKRMKEITRAVNRAKSVAKRSKVDLSDTVAQLDSELIALTQQLADAKAKTNPTEKREALEDFFEGMQKIFDTVGIVEGLSNAGRIRQQFAAELRQFNSRITALKRKKEDTSGLEATYGELKAKFDEMTAALARRPLDQEELFSLMEEYNELRQSFREQLDELTGQESELPQVQGERFNAPKLNLGAFEGLRPSGPPGGGPQGPGGF